tara:strand:+ start:71 stop:880 length:810 start_codon:yes stop_codon:yes gene_type:complete
MVFISISIYFFIKYEKNTNKLNNILFCAFFLALCAYLRPIYSIFSIYFFLNFFLNLKISKKLIYYILLNIILAFPALYYVLILDVNKWATSYLFRENIFTILSLVSSIIIFYIFPFVIKYYNSILKGIINFKNIFIYLVLLLLIFFFFEYDRSYSGGILFKFSNLIFDNNYLFFFTSSLCIMFIYILFFSRTNRNIFDLILILILFMLEMDGVVYHETYDPLIYILIILLFKNKIFEKFINKFNLNSFLILFFFLIVFYFSAVVKTIWL